MSKHYIYRMDILENDTYRGAYIGQHKIGSKDPSCDGYKGSGCKWKREILRNHIPVEKTILKICGDIRETNYWEQYYVEQAIQSGEILWNVVKGGGGHEGERVYTDDEIKEHNKVRFNRWYASNQEHIVNYRKQYHKNNKERLYAYNRKRIENNKEAEQEYHRQYYQKNKERLSELNKQRYEQNKERRLAHMREYGKQYRATHVEQLREKGRRYNDENKERRKQYYSRLCCYNEETLTYRALASRFRRMGIKNPSEIAKQYLIGKEI